MNRLSFLKTLGVGVAAAVITPKLLIEPLPEKVLKTGGIMPVLEKKGKEAYGHYEEPWLHSNDVETLRLWDMCIDRDSRCWLCTAKGIDSVDLTALESDPLPNFIEVKKGVFAEYFIIMSSCHIEQPSYTTVDRLSEEWLKLHGNERRG
jgi:hypothetical protein